MRRALEIAPMSYNFLADMGQMHYFAGEYEEAERYCLKALESKPDFVFAHQYLSYIYLARREDDKAFEEMLKVNDAFYPASSRVKSKQYEEDKAREQANTRDIYRRSGLKGIWRHFIDLSYKKTGILYYCANLYIHTLLGEKEEALGALEKSYERREFMLPFVNIDPVFDGLRTEPRFQAVMKKMKLAL